MLVPVLRAAPVTLDQHISYLTTQWHATALHAHYPSLESCSKLELDCSKHSAFACCSLLSTFASLAPSTSKALKLEYLTLEPTEDSLGMQGLVELFTAWYAAVGAIRKQSISTVFRQALRGTGNAANSSSSPTAISIICARMHTNHYKLLLQPLPDSPALQSLELRDLRQLPYNSRGKSFIKHLALIMQNIKNLRSLKLADIDDGNPFGFETRFRDLIEACSDCTKLTELELLFTDTKRLREAHKPVANCVRSMTMLRRLSLDCIDRSWSTEGCTAFTNAITSLPEVTYLSLAEHDPSIGRPWGSWAQADIQGPWQQIIDGLVGLTTLQRLSLTKLRGPDSAAEALSRALKCMGSLVEFQLEFLRDWRAEGVLNILETLRFHCSCTKLVFTGKCVTYATYESSAVLITALVRGFLIPSLCHLDITLHRDTTQNMGTGMRSIEREVRAELDGSQGGVVDVSFPDLTHLRFAIEPGAARTVMYAAMHGMHALQHLDISVVGLGCEIAAGNLSKHEFASLEAALAVLSAMAPLRTLHANFQVLPTSVFLVMCFVASSALFLPSWFSKHCTPAPLSDNGARCHRVFLGVSCQNTTTPAHGSLAIRGGIPCTVQPSCNFLLPPPAHTCMCTSARGCTHEQCRRVRGAYSRYRVRGRRPCWSFSRSSRASRSWRCRRRPAASPMACMRRCRALPPSSGPCPVLRAS